MTKKRVKPGTSKRAAEDRRARFVEAMLTNGGNQTQAAITAGFPKKSAHVRGAELVKDRKVATLLQARMAEALAKSKLTADEVLQSLARTVRFDPRKLYREDGSLKPVHELDADTADALAGVEVVEMAGGMKISLPGLGKSEGKGKANGTEQQPEEPVLQHIPMYTKKVKWLDKNTAREQAMKHFGHFEADNKQKPAPTVNVGVLTVPPQALNFDQVKARALTLKRAA